LICNGVDDDCDGLIDEGYVPAVTFCGIGICSANGLMQCISGIEVDSCVAGNPETEVCDGLDNNCDGIIDEGCSNCVENIVNDSWDEWVNVSGCINGTIDQLRTMVEYDFNNCGTFDNVIHNETREINCSLPTCFVDENCSADYYGGKYCDGDDVYKTFYDFSCVNGSCVKETSKVFVKECDDDCEDGMCVEDDDNDNSWNSVFSTNYVPSRIAPLAVIELDGKPKEVSLWWLWILFLVIVILFLALMIIRIMLSQKSVDF